MKRVLFPVTGLALAACLWGCEVNIENPGVAGDAGNNGGADVTPNNSTNNNGNNGNNNNSNNGNNDTPDAGNNDRVDLGHDDMGNPISNDEWPCKDLGIEKERCQGGAEWDAYEGDQALIDRGEYLALHVAACTDCHTPLTADFMPQEGCESWWSIRACDAPMSGWNTPFYDLAPEIEGVGAIGIPAITPHPDALGEWTPEELRMAFTKGIRPEWYTERPRIMIPYMPYNQFFHLTKEDEDAIIAYLHSIPPSPPVVTEFDEREPMEAGSVWEKFDTLEPADLDGDGVLDGLGGPTPTSGMPAITLDATDPNFEKAEHGRYLTEIACASCHTPALAPDPTLEGEDLLAQYNFREPSLTLAGSVEAALPNSSWFVGPLFGYVDVPKIGVQNITNHEDGVGTWTIDEVLTSVNGYDKSNQPMCPPMPVDTWFSQLTAEDKEAIAFYLKNSEGIANVTNGIEFDCKVPTQ